MGIRPAHYNWNNLKKVFKNPQMFRGEINRIGNRINTRFHNFQDTDTGIRVMEEDWDNLLLLDGCRYDIYAEQANLGGKLQCRMSRGSDSWEFMRENFVDRELHDTVYVTANPHVHKLDDGIFHYVYNLLEDHWDPDLQTVPPGVVSEEARRIQGEFPHKRLLVHFMQPHFPFIGEKGRQLDQIGMVLDDDADTDDQIIWTKLMYGLTDKDRVWEAYRENLDLVLSVVDDLVEDLPGKTVISSDHGNLVGERVWPIPTRGYGHPRGMRARELLEIPWDVLSADQRRDVRTDPPQEIARLDDEVVENRLRNLGYR